MGAYKSNVKYLLLLTGTKMKCDTTVNQYKMSSLEALDLRIYNLGMCNVVCLIQDQRNCFVLSLCKFGGGLIHLTASSSKGANLKFCLCLGTALKASIANVGVPF